MLRTKDSIPPFIQSFGNDFFSYVLNISLTDAIKLLQTELKLNDTQNRVLDDITQTCRSLRAQHIDQADLDLGFYFSLGRALIENQTHVVNYWRFQCGGKTPVVDDQDDVIRTFKLLAIEMYPSFLIRSNSREHMYMHHGAGISFKHILGRPLTDLVINDRALRKLFNNIGANSKDTFIKYRSSTGSGGMIQLAGFAELVLVKAYYLMVLAGKGNIISYLLHIESIIKLLREIAINKEAIVPVYVGYSNIALPDEVSFDILQGTLMSFNDKLLSILPQSARPTLTDEGLSAFVYRGEYPYKFEFQTSDDDYELPTEFKSSHQKLNTINEELQLAISLACRRTPAVSLKNTWKLTFDPLSPGINFSWASESMHPTQHYSCSQEETDAIKYWCKKINETYDDNIAIAKRKLLSSISHRQNPIDSFIDAVIVWENLFGANAELSFRISSAISCLLEKDKAKRKELYKKVKKAYDTRSSVVHGVKEIDYNKAVEFRDFAVEICLNCLTELYQNYSELIEKKDRSLTILLEHE